MARDKIKVQLPVQDATQSVEVATFAKKTVTQANGIEIQNALENKNNSLMIVVEPTTAQPVTIKAGDAYPNSMLGDLAVVTTNTQPNVILLEDISRFERKDGSIYLDFGIGFVGTIYAVAKRAGVKPVV